MEFDLMSAISTVGFPIAACCALFWLYTKMLPILTELSTNTKDMRESLESMRKTLDLFNQNFVEIFKRLAELEAANDRAKEGKHVDNS